MKALKFKTDIKCGGCIEKVTPHLNHVAGENKWKVDIADPGKILSVEDSNISEKEVIEAVNKAGFKAEKI